VGIGALLKLNIKEKGCFYFTCLASSLQIIRSFTSPSIHAWSGREETIKDHLGRVKRLEENAYSRKSFL